jgi:hypothetical protein
MPFPSISRNWCFLLTICLLMTMTGCVRRRLTVRTNPPGALAYLDNQVIGTTPVSTAFTYYGARDVRIEKDGFQTHVIRHRLDPPWYQIPPLDFITETLLPKEIRDERVVDVTLTPELPQTNERIAQRADELRVQARQGVIPATAPGTEPLTPIVVPGAAAFPPTELPIPATPVGPQRLPSGGVSFEPSPQ